MAQVLLSGGPADGMRCELHADTAWITVLDGQPVILPTDWGRPGHYEHLRNILNRADRNWSYYEAEPVQPPLVPVFTYRGHSNSQHAATARPYSPRTSPA
jgi:hypothetical protein